VPLLLSRLLVSSFALVGFASTAAASVGCEGAFEHWLPVAKRDADPRPEQDLLFFRAVCPAVARLKGVSAATFEPMGFYLSIPKEEAGSQIASGVCPMLPNDGRERLVFFYDPTEWAAAKTAGDLMKNGGPTGLVTCRGSASVSGR
jgi:hypothetical protein